MSETTSSNPDVYALAEEAAAALTKAFGIERCHAAIVLGSGWRPAADVLTGRADEVHEIAMAELPGFLAPTAQGHGGTIRAARFGQQWILVLLGRTHAYEGHELWRCAHAVRTAAAAGAVTVVLTNAAGGLDADMQVGDTVLISDHINMTGKTPLRGARFVDLVDAYSPVLRAEARQLRPSMREAVYAMMPGPQYETPAEIRMLRTLGAGLVGMSTVYETIAAREAGLNVLGISLVTNAAAGMTGEPLNHEEVLAAGQAAAQDVGDLLSQLVVSGDLVASAATASTSSADAEDTAGSK